MFVFNDDLCLWVLINKFFILFGIVFWFGVGLIFDVVNSWKFFVGEDWKLIVVV